MKEVFFNAIYKSAEAGKKKGVKREKIKVLLFPAYRAFCKVSYKLFGHLYFYHVEIPVTQKCSLRCKDCSFMMPYFEAPVDYSLDTLLTSMDKLFECVDTIQIFRILGGEPFLYKDLDVVIDKAIKCKKVRTVDVVTNGTIIPSEKELTVMKSEKFSLQISDYGDISTKKEEIINLCEKHGIKCVVRSMVDKNWFSAGDLHFRGRGPKELRKQLKNCAGICRSLQNGKLYFCPRASFGTLLGIPDPESDYVDLLSARDKKELRRQLFELNSRKSFAACNYCDEGSEMYKPITPARQITNRAEIDKWRSTISKR